MFFKKEYLKNLVRTNLNLSDLKRMLCTRILEIKSMVFTHLDDVVRASTIKLTSDSGKHSGSDSGSDSATTPVVNTIITCSFITSVFIFVVFITISVATVASDTECGRQFK